MNDHSLALQSMYGAYAPSDPIEKEWIVEFVRANILHLCSMIVPGEDVECIFDSGLYLDSDSRRRAIIDYVPVRDGLPVSDTRVIGRTVDRHLFVIRPVKLQNMLTKNGRSIEVPDVYSVSNLWSYVGESMRMMIRRRCGQSLKPAYISVLLANGMDRRQAEEAQLCWVRVCEACDYRDYEMEVYIDLMNVSVLITHLVSTSAYYGELMGKPVDPRLVIKALLHNVPDTLL